MKVLDGNAKLIQELDAMDLREKIKRRPDEFNRH